MINSDKNLILIKNEDQTEKIVRWTCEKGHISITFTNDRTYQYNYQNVQFFKDPEFIHPKYVYVMKNGVPLYGLHKVLQFQYHTKLIYENGYHETVENQSLDMIRSALDLPRSKDVFSYLKQLAITVGVKGEDGKNILANRYEKITFIREDSILAAFLSGEMKWKAKKKGVLIYPFGFNLSQKQAVENAICNSLSVIEGPPGTGKTQTILNIIANAIMNGDSAAVVSSNNSATENVLEKLKKYGIDFIAAYLGNQTNKKEFIESQKIQLPDLKDWYIETDELHKTQTELAQMSQQLDVMLERKNQLAKDTQELEQLQTEYEHYMTYYDETIQEEYKVGTKTGMKSDKMLRLIMNLENEKVTKDTIWNLIRYKVRYGLSGRQFFKISQDKKIALCQKLFYETRIKELKERIQSASGQLKEYDFSKKMDHYSALSLRLLRAKIEAHYHSQSFRQSYELEDLWKSSERFIQEYPIILSTTYSLRSSLSSQFVYDYVIVDEASQVDLATGALALSCAKKAVIVGDLKQLPNVVPPEVKKKTDELFEHFTLESAYRYSDHSLLSSIHQLFKDIPYTLLKEHYRCHPKIIQFCNQKFYHDELIILSESKGEKEPLVVYKTVKGNHARDHRNVRQAEVIANEVIPEQKLDAAEDSIGIVTPYRNQADYLQEAFKNSKVKADTVDKFQGQECDTIIISTVDDEISDFADDPNRLNVAVSRAVKQLIVVADGNESIKQSNLRELIEYIEYQNCSVKESKIYSVFDYLYQSYSEMRIQYLKDKKRVSEYDSENLMYALLQTILQSEEAYANQAIAVHVPLRMIIRDLSKLSEEKIKYVMAAGTHIDFVIYAKVSRKVMLAVEVDGYAYHKNGSKQAQRDEIKNSVFETYQIPYIRCKTNESGEEQRIREKLEQVQKEML